MRILVVYDESGVREAVERALRLKGHDVALAADGVRRSMRSMPGRRTPSSSMS